VRGWVASDAQTDQTDPTDQADQAKAAPLAPALNDRVFYSAQPLAPEGKIAFVFPGSGNHYADMGRGLFAAFPEVLRAQDAENESLRTQFQPEAFWNVDALEDVDEDHKAMIFGQVALGTAVSDLLRGCGVAPAAVIGYSLGETAGLFALRAWTARDEMLRRMEGSSLFTRDLAGECEAARRRWQLPKQEAVDWVLGVIDRPMKVAKAALEHRKKVYPLISNTFSESVVGGNRKAVEKLVENLKCRFIPLHGVTTVHCEVVEEVREEYRNLHLFETTPPPGVRFYSGAWGRAYELSRETAADSVLAQAIDGVDFPKVIEAAHADGVRVFLEMGPGNSCTRMIRGILGDRPHLARAFCHAGQPPVSVFLRGLAAAIAAGVPVDLGAVFGEEGSEGQKGQKLVTVRAGVGALVAPAAPVVVREGKRSREPVEQVPHASKAEAWAGMPMQTHGLEARATRGPEAHAADPLVEQLVRAESAKGAAHAAYLEFAGQMRAVQAGVMQWQLTLPPQARGLEGMGNGGATAASRRAGGSDWTDRTDQTDRTDRSDREPGSPAPAEVQPGSPAGEPHAAPLSQVSVAFTREQCLEFATGSIARVLGPAFAAVDAHPTRVRLPDEPLMLVDRILEVEGAPRSLGAGRVVTEHDVLPGGWYLDCNRIPTCVAVEAGQADLFLCAYLGIDFETRGHAMYRLLDAEVTFHSGLPQPGQVIRYDIHIERFFRHGNPWFFNFHFEASVAGRPLMSMRNGCAGFFTEQELAAGQGVVTPAIDSAPARGALPPDWAPFVAMGPEAYDARQLEALRAGDLAGCFGAQFAGLPLRDPLRIPGGKMQLVDRVTALEPEGGRFGIGFIRAEADIQPDDWFLTCHFVDDRVMPGTLMFECCLHTLRVLLLRMGWVGELHEAAWEPVPGVMSRLKCRGQVLETTRLVTYEVTVKELGYGPEPFAIADARMYADGKPIVDILNMSLRLTGLSRERIAAIWRGRDIPLNPPSKGEIGNIPLNPPSKGDLRGAGMPMQAHGLEARATPGPAYEHSRILAYAEGKPSEAFGERYKIFDADRRLARLPRPPYLFLDQVNAVTGAPWEMSAQHAVETQYFVPPDAWYFAANRDSGMPFAVLLEIALQPCGWLAAYMGSALTSEVDLKFRNLGGVATQHLAVTPESGLLTVRVRSTNVSSSGGMIIQHYAMEVHSAQGLAYDGTTYFGFFSEQALADQVGIRDAKRYQPEAAEQARARALPYPEDAPFPDARLRMVDAVTVFVPDGGPKGLGYIQGTKQVDPEDWFFRAHFYQDPVCPGSLGLESFLQLLKLVASERWGLDAGARFETVALGQQHRWTYRGQIIPTDACVTVEAVITGVDDLQRVLHADGFLSVDGRVIYQMQDFTLRA